MGKNVSRTKVTQLGRFHVLLGMIPDFLPLPSLIARGGKRTTLLLKYRNNYYIMIFLLK